MPDRVCEGLSAGLVLQPLEEGVGVPPGCYALTEERKVSRGLPRTVAVIVSGKIEEPVGRP